jgi:hypothetical protein
MALPSSAVEHVSSSGTSTPLSAPPPGGPLDGGRCALGRTGLSLGNRDPWSDTPVLGRPVC